MEPPETFDFPFTPYEIQHDFMRELYRTLEGKKCGIFESPTGTGKSLSIICGALRWLKDHNQRERESLKNEIERLSEEKEKLNSDAGDWLTAQAQEIVVTRKLNELRLTSDKVNNFYKRLDDLKVKKKVTLDRSKFVKNKSTGATMVDAPVKAVDDDDEEGFLLDDVETRDENDEEVDDKYSPVKIFICSRTHSQLTQFVGEIKKSPYGGDTRVVSLASRQNYCVNPEVTRLRNVNLMNEKCLDLQKSQKNKTTKTEGGKVVKRRKGSSCKCPYYKQQAIEDLRDHTLSEVQDIEDLVTAARILNACPYYSSRKAVEEAEVVLVPYNTILHKATREANGIKLKNNVVIIDEAHNLLEAMAQMYSSEVNYDQLFHSLQQLRNYKTKYSTRFSSKNLLCINQLIFVVSQLKIELEKTVKLKDNATAEIHSIQNFVLGAEIDNYNMFKLVKFAKESKISQKLHSFTVKHPEPAVTVKKDPKQGLKNFLASIENKGKPTVDVADPATVKPAPSNPLLAVISFLESLTYSYGDGRILVYRGDVKKLHFLLLNPSENFQELVSETRSIIVAGGTMKPISEFRDRLLVNSGVEPSRISEFSCDHIVPPENILPVAFKNGPKKGKLLFNFESRFRMGESLKRLLKDACDTVKGGIVVFFPSYKYESWLWEQVKGVNFGRPVFREPKESGGIDSVLDNYQKAIYKSECRGALMFSVVGGKLSEGLNFSDELGRCVIVVGLPYPNIYAPDLKEKMAFLDKREGSGAGNKFYENLCMKAVNQCIGRAVRHKGDYASVILFDERYDRASTKNALPDWIKRSLKSCDYDDAFREIKKFFQSKK